MNGEIAPRSRLRATAHVDGVQSKKGGAHPNDPKIPPDESRVRRRRAEFSTPAQTKTKPLGWKEISVNALRVLTVDDMTLVREGIQRLLKDRDSLEVIGEAADAEEAAELLERLNPDVILLDQSLPGLDTSDIITLFKQRRAHVEVIVLSEVPDEERALRALEAGASAYVLKDITTDNLVHAIHGVCDGRTFMHPEITRQLVDRFRTLMRERANHGDGGHLGGLTSRELEVVIEMAKGATDREIARKTSLAESTVKSHIRSILRKIGARNRTQAVAFVLQRGLMR